ncbi:hypothetical protein GCM10027044_19090 [Hymenobacter ruber]
MACALSSCKKDASAPDKTKMLVAHPWRTTAHKHIEAQEVIVGAPFVTVEDSYARYNACYRDNILTFQNDNQAISNTGSLHCSSAEPASFNNHWYLTKDEGTLLTDGLYPMLGQNYVYGSILEYELVDLTDSTLKLKISSHYSQSSFPVSVTDEYTFSAL